MNTNDPRALALDLLVRAERSDQFSNISLDNALKKCSMSDADKRLASVLFYGVTEKRIALDYRISKLSSRPIDELDANVRNALRLGVYQLTYLDRIPPHAAINETVALCNRKTSGFVNAVLRAHTRTPESPLPSRDNMAEYLSVRFSVCTALAERLLTSLGESLTEDVLEGFERIPETTLRVNTLKCSREELLTHIDGATPTSSSPDGLHVKGSVRELYGFCDGLFFVQDEASQICVRALDAKKGDRVLDICACPGSKSFGAAMTMKGEGEIRSFDLHENKLSLIRSGAERLGIGIITANAQDGKRFLPELEASADRVLCDVPCSGFGVLAKKPELRYKDPSASAALPSIQLEILNNASRYVKEGGILVYSTCTILPEENEKNVLAFLDGHPEFSLCPWSVGEISADSGMLTLYPHVHETDGFFIAKLERKRL